MSIATNTINTGAGAPRNWQRYALWGAQAALAALFLFGGASKFFMSAETMTKEIDWPMWFLYFIGAAEIAGGLGLLLPGISGIQRWLTPVAAGGLIIIMIGAAVSTAIAMSIGAAAMPFVVGLVAAAVLYARRDWLAER